MIVLKPIIIYGPPGNGKTVICQHLRKFKEYKTGDKGVKLNCGQIPEGMVQHYIGGVDGTGFTDVKDKKGAVRKAGKGILILEEFGKIKDSDKNSFNETFDDDSNVVPVGSTEGFKPECNIIINLEEDPYNSGFPPSLIDRCEVIQIKGINSKEREADSSNP